jgi:hypothetical protein
MTSMTVTTALHFRLLIAALLAAIVAMPLRADDGGAIAAFTQAFSGSDAGAKRTALTAIAAMGQDADDTVYPLLVQAVGDPQTQDVAVLALRARTAQSSHPYDRAPSNPSFLPLDSPADWNRWLAVRTQYKERERALADLARRLAALSKDDAGGTKTTTASATASAAAEQKPAKSGPPPPTDLGKLSRIIFTDGATVVGHVVDLHRAADGTVLSVEFFHRDGGGREVIPIDRVARIEDAP